MFTENLLINQKVTGSQKSQLSLVEIILSLLSLFLPHYWHPRRKQLYYTTASSNRIDVNDDNNVNNNNVNDNNVKDSNVNDDNQANVSAEPGLTVCGAIM